MIELAGDNDKLRLAFLTQLTSVTEKEREIERQTDASIALCNCVARQKCKMSVNAVFAMCNSAVVLILCFYQQ